MSISKFNHKFNINKTQNNLPLQSLRSFKATENSDDNLHAVTLNKFSEDDIYCLSAYAPDKKLAKIASNTMKMLFITIPVLDSAASGIMKSGNLSAKLAKSAATAGKWGIVFAAGAAVSGSKYFINSKVKPLDNFDKKHPVLSTIFDFAVIYPVFDVLHRNVKKLPGIFKDKFPQTASAFNNSLKAPVKKLLNNSLVNKKIVMPAEKFAAKRLYLSKAAKFSSVMMVPALALASLIRFDKEVKNRNIQVDKNIRVLKAINDTISSN